MIFRSTQKKEVSFINYKLKPIHPKVNRHSKYEKVNLALDPQDQNPVYRHLINERNNKHIFQFILNQAFSLEDSKRRTFSQNCLRDKMYSPNFNAFSRNERSHTCKELETLRTQGKNIFEEADEVIYDLRKKKKKIGILNKYNNEVDRYVKFIPKTYEQSQKELLIAHEEVRNLCTQKTLPKKESMNTKAASFKEFVEPKVNIKIFRKKKMTHRRIKTTAVFQASADSLAFRHRTIHL